ncbi:MAG TPA: ribonuclease VapC [Methanobacteriaceae archaeon]|nr:ribonuclease VapC [Methanobacteriaceae archaeon]HNS25705.1 ribonuclease VapC [Methanobacteriaceae archaeon]
MASFSHSNNKKCKVYVLDTSAIIGRFLSPDTTNITTNGVIMEIKDFNSRIFTENAREDGKLLVREPAPWAFKKVKRMMEESGDVLRLSGVDIGVLALAVTLTESYQPQLVTDDYSMQNLSKILKIPYRGVLTPGIEDVYHWILICQGCKKRYQSHYNGSDCEICGSKLIKRRIKVSKRI